MDLLRINFCYFFEDFKFFKGLYILKILIMKMRQFLGRYKLLYDFKNSFFKVQFSNGVNGYSFGNRCCGCFCNILRQQECIVVGGV